MNQITQKEATQSERFMNKVVAEYGTSVGEVALTNFQKRLAQNYFVAVDSALKAAEEKRLKKSNNKDPLAITWASVNMEKLSRDVIARARIGFDPAQPNHISMMPFKNNGLNKYDIVFIEGYRGMELKAVKYGLDVPDKITVEVVYSTDRFKSFKKDRNNAIEGYEFEITNEFDRGTIIGGFYYHEYYQTPLKNKVVVLNLKDIEKRKPAYASVEFWGGEKDVYKNGQKTGEKEKVEGWYEKMVYKTIYRAAHGDVTIDSQKIDDDYMQLKQAESEFSEVDAAREIGENANRQAIDIEHEIIDGEPVAEPAASNEGSSSNSGSTTGGPDF